MRSRTGIQPSLLPKLHLPLVLSQHLTNTTPVFPQIFLESLSFFFFWLLFIHLFFRTEEKYSVHFPKDRPPSWNFTETVVEHI